MNYVELIKHVIGNAYVYINDYSKKDKLTDMEKGILTGLRMDVDSINNELIIRKIHTKSEIVRKKIDKIQKELDLEKLMYDLVTLITEK